MVVAAWQTTVLTGWIPLTAVLKEQGLLVHIVHRDVHIHTPVNRAVRHGEHSHLQGTALCREQALYLMQWQVIKALNESSALLPVRGRGSACTDVVDAPYYSLN